MAVHITGGRPLWLLRVPARIADNSQKALLGLTPELPAPSPPPAASDPRPEADPALNRCLALRVKRAADTLVLELDYVAARTKGFTLEKVRGYYLQDSPTFVVALGEPWTSNIGKVSFPDKMAQVSDVDLIVSKSRNLRLLIHTRSMRMAKDAKLRVSSTATGMRAEIQFPR